MARTTVNKLSPSADAPRRVTVRVYDLYGLTRDERRTALGVTVEAFAAVDVALTWIDCTGEHRPDVCGGLLPRGDVLLRLIPHRHRDPEILGTAMVQPGGPSVLATVYTPALVDRAVATRIPLSTIVGRVSAHEIAHLLLGTPAHSATGLMRPNWNIRRTNPEDWRFSSRDAEALQGRAAIGRERAAAARTAN